MEDDQRVQIKVTITDSRINYSGDPVYLGEILDQHRALAHYKRQDTLETRRYQMACNLVVMLPVVFLLLTLITAVIFNGISSRIQYQQQVNHETRI